STLLCTTEITCFSRLNQIKNVSTKPGAIQSAPEHIVWKSSVPQDGIEAIKQRFNGNSLG
ncbi:hypothetical protein ACE4RV_03770, partial [Acetobacter persici]|uniref:hypothetical protein n=1 Tax=Acetobacter persici TaxID=1076596 RepID=UPI0036D8FAE7